MSDALIFERAGPVATMVFNRPRVLNAINADMAARFARACREISDDLNIRAIVLRGEGRAFLAGGDLAEFEADPTGIPRNLIGPMHEGLKLLSEHRAPLISRVQGAVAGAGFSLCCASDLVIAAADVKFTFAYTRVAASGDMGVSWTLPRIVGARRALQMALLDEPITAQEAQTLGIVTKVVTVDELDAALAQVVQKIVAAPPIAVGEMKRLFKTEASSDFATQLSREEESFATCCRSEDFLEALAAVKEKRSGQFRGV